MINNQGPILILSDVETGLAEVVAGLTPGTKYPHVANIIDVPAPGVAYTEWVYFVPYVVYTPTSASY